MKGKGKPAAPSGRLRLDSGQHRRIRITMAVLALAAFLPLAARLWYLMVAQYDYYAALARRNQSRTTAVASDRGEILDRNMNVLATNRGVENVYLNPRELQQAGEDTHAVSQMLGQLLEKDPDAIEKKAGDRTRRYQQIAARIPAETAAKLRDYINDQDIQGIHLEPAAERVYPYGTLAAQVVGFTNAGGDGCEGVEAAYDSYLRGLPGKVITTKGNNEMDMPYSYEQYLASQKGNTVVLTLDATVQACLEKQMAAAIDRYDVQNGAFGMVMNCKTGEILAMATLGSYDPNAYQEIQDEKTRKALEEMMLAYLACPEESGEYAAGKKAYQQALQAARLKQWRNRCLSDGYEPGSTFKVLTMAAALDCGAITLDTSFHCSGAEQIPGRAQRLHCWRSTGHGAEKTPQALQNSCNIAFAHIALKLGGERFYEYIQKFGILEKTGIDLAGESKGVFFDKALVTNTDKWGTASLTSGSFGQTFKITPLQLVRAIASVVNGGYLLEPYVVSEVLDAQGNPVLRQEPTVVRRTISEETSRTMRQLIRSVVTEGTAKNAAVAGYSIGGKTGTSEKIDVFDENGQRVQDKIVSFVGIAPMEDPQYIVLVALDTPSRSTGIYISGGVMAAPTVGAVLGDILPYLEVEKETPGEPISLPDFTGMTVGQAEKALKDTGITKRCSGTEEKITSQLPRAGELVYPGSQVLLYLGDDPGQSVEVPDFSGMTRRQAGDAAAKAGLLLQILGNPDLSPQIVVSGQDLPPGSKTPPGTAITLYFTDPTAKD